MDLVLGDDDLVRREFEEIVADWDPPPPTPPPPAAADRSPGGGHPGDPVRAVGAGDGGRPVAPCVVGRQRSPPRQRRRGPHGR